MSGKYDDIIALPHHQSPTRKRMTMTERAAQFSPFAALTGYGDEIKEARRATDERPILDRDARERLDRRLIRLLGAINDRPTVAVSWFVPDKKKSGGTVRRCESKAVKLDGKKDRLLLENGEWVPLADILSVDGSLFDEREE